MCYINYKETKNSDSDVIFFSIMNPAGHKSEPIKMQEQ